MKANVGKGSSLAWRWRNAVAESDLDAATKHILVELHSFMKPDGRRCFPTQALIAARTSLSERTVRGRLAVAEAAGWIEMQKGRFDGKKNGTYTYEPRFPDATCEPDAKHRKMTTEGPANGG